MSLRQVRSYAFDRSRKIISACGCLEMAFLPKLSIAVMTSLVVLQKPCCDSNILFVSICFIKRLLTMRSKSLSTQLERHIGLRLSAVFGHFPGLGIGIRVDILQISGNIPFFPISLYASNSFFFA